MPSEFDTAPNFINPAYATPEQLASLREYSKQLMTGTGQQKVQRASQGFSNIVNALVGGYEGYRADQLQQQALQQGSAQTEALIAKLLEQPDQSGSAPSPAPSSAPVASADPTIPAPPRPEVPSSPTVVGDLEGVASGLYEPTSSPAPVGGAPAPGGVQAPAMTRAAAPASFSQRFNGISPRELATVLMNPMVPEQNKAMIRGLITPAAGADVYGRPVTTSIISGVKPMPVGAGVQPGVRTEVGVGNVKAPAIITPPGSAPAANMRVPGFNGAGGNGIDALAAKDRELGRLGVINAAGSGGQGGVVKEDIEFANQAPQVLKTVGTIADNIKRFGDKLTFGPTAPWSQEVKKLAANYAPGIMKDQLDAIAAADSIEKLSGNLGSLLSRQLSSGTGTDAQMYQGLKTVPGLMQSKEGALAMADMIRQAAEKQQQLGYILQNPNNWANYGQTKAEFFAQHPIINPLTGHPIEMDIRAASQATPAASGGWSIRPVTK